MQYLYRCNPSEKDKKEEKNYKKEENSTKPMTYLILKCSLAR